MVLKLVVNNGKTRRSRLHNVLYVPELAYNLISVSKTTKAEKHVKFHDDECKFLDEKKVIATGYRKKSLYY